MTFAASHFPPGMHAGDRIVTNKKYAKVYPKSPPVRHGVVVAGKHIGHEVTVKLEDQKLPQRLDCRLFDVIK